MTILYSSDDEIPIKLSSVRGRAVADVLAMFPRCRKCGEALGDGPSVVLVYGESGSVRAAHGGCVFVDGMIVNPMSPLSAPPAERGRAR